MYFISWRQHYNKRQHLNERYHGNFPPPLIAFDFELKQSFNQSLSRTQTLLHIYIWIFFLRSFHFIRCETFNERLWFDIFNTKYLYEVCLRVRAWIAVSLWAYGFFLLLCVRAELPSKQHLYIYFVARSRCRQRDLVWHGFYSVFQHLKNDETNPSNVWHVICI